MPAMSVIDGTGSKIGHHAVEVLREVADPDLINAGKEAVSFLGRAAEG